VPCVNCAMSASQISLTQRRRERSFAGLTESRSATSDESATSWETPLSLRKDASYETCLEIWYIDTLEGSNASARHDRVVSLAEGAHRGGGGWWMKDRRRDGGRFGRVSSVSARPCRARGQRRVSNFANSFHQYRTRPPEPRRTGGRLHLTGRRGETRQRAGPKRAVKRRLTERITLTGSGTEPAPTEGARLRAGTNTSYCGG